MCFFMPVSVRLCTHPLRFTRSGSSCGSIQLSCIPGKRSGAAARSAPDGHVLLLGGRRYATVSGDFNPIHLTAASAKLFGFRQAIAHGLWTKARALAAMLPRQPIGQAEVTVEFKTPLYLPGRASLWATRQVKGTFPHNAIFEVRNAKGDKPHLRAQLGYAVAA